MDNKALIESRWGRERSPDHVLLIGLAQAAADLVIGEGGQISAALLTEYIEKSTGMRLERSPTSGASRKEARTYIHVGITSFVNKRIPDLHDLDEDGFVIETQGSDHLIIAGPTSWGTEHGVRAFLEQFLGVRWLMPGPRGEHVPHLNELVIPMVSIRESPIFLNRTQQ